jgi:RAB protein geranylgeranyltransferase component A
MEGLEEYYDLVIVGTGLPSAASRRGKKVLHLEKHDLYIAMHLQH